ncbi:MAG: HAD family phosphatase [Candidatus Aenigmatarchaeota archaeon]
MIKAIIFDFGGVCFYPGNSSQLLLEAIFRSKLLKIKLISIFFSSKRNEIKKLVDKFNEAKLNEDDLFREIKRITRYNFSERDLKKQIIDLNKPIKPVIEILEKLKNRYKLCLLTNNNSWLDEINEKHRFYQYFDVIINSYNVKVAKPNRKIFEIALSKLKFKPNECIFIDDKKENVLAAEEYGINSIKYKNPKQLIKDLKKFGVKL